MVARRHGNRGPLGPAVGDMAFGSYCSGRDFQPLAFPGMHLPSHAASRSSEARPWPWRANLQGPRAFDATRWTCPANGELCHTLTPEPYRGPPWEEGGWLGTRRALQGDLAVTLALCDSLGESLPQPQSRAARVHLQVAGAMRGGLRGCVFHCIQHTLPGHLFEQMSGSDHTQEALELF